MVVSTENKDIFKTEAKHIAFAINKEGYNDAGFAGAVFSQILIGMHDSDKNIILNADITLEEVLENCEKNRRRSK